MCLFQLLVLAFQFSYELPLLFVRVQRERQVSRHSGLLQHGQNQTIVSCLLSQYLLLIKKRLLFSHLTTDVLSAANREA